MPDRRPNSAIENCPRSSFSFRRRRQRFAINLMVCGGTTDGPGHFGFLENFLSNHVSYASGVFMDNNYLGLASVPEPPLVAPMAAFAGIFLFVRYLKRSAR